MKVKHSDHIHFVTKCLSYQYETLLVTSARTWSPDQHARMIPGYLQQVMHVCEGQGTSRDVQTVVREGGGVYQHHCDPDSHGKQ